MGVKIISVRKWGGEIRQGQPGLTPAWGVGRATPAKRKGSGEDHMEIAEGIGTYHAAFWHRAFAGLWRLAEGLLGSWQKG
jgi:hypothetical protein